MANVFEALIEKCTLNVLDVNGVVEVLKYAANSAGIENVINIILNGPEHINVDKGILKYHIEKRYERKEVEILDIVASPVEREFRVNYNYKTTRYFDNEECSGYGNYRQTDTYKYPKEVIDDCNNSIPFDAYYEAVNKMFDNLNTH